MPIIVKRMVFRAAEENNEDVLTLWIKQKGDINIRDDDGDTVLMIAIINGHTNLARNLIRWTNINKNAQNNEGVTALHLAALTNNLPIIKELLYFGAKKQIKDKHGDTAENWAADEGHAEATDILHSYEQYPKSGSRKHKMEGGRRGKLSNNPYTKKNRK